MNRLKNRFKQLRQSRNYLGVLKEFKNETEDCSAEMVMNDHEAGYLTNVTFVLLRTQGLGQLRPDVSHHHPGL